MKLMLVGIDLLEVFNCIRTSRPKLVTLLIMVGVYLECSIHMFW
jgi:hypothetical protein